MICRRPIPLTAAFAAVLALAGCSKPAEQEAASAEPTAPSSEWVAPNPTEPAVEVTLPAASAPRGADQTASPSATAATPEAD